MIYVVFFDGEYAKFDKKKLAKSFMKSKKITHDKVYLVTMDSYVLSDIERQQILFL